MGDLRTTFEGGDDAALAHIPTNEKASVEEFQRMLACVSPHHILKLFAPEKLDAITNILDGIESLADFNQRLNKHMAAQAALEPIHSVLCDMLRSGMDFGAAAERCPLAIATQAMRHQCSTPDDDAVTFAKAAPGNRNRSSKGPKIRETSDAADQETTSPIERRQIVALGTKLKTVVSISKKILVVGSNVRIDTYVTFVEVQNMAPLSAPTMKRPHSLVLMNYKFKDAIFFNKST